MVTEKEMKDAGYVVLKKGAWLHMGPEFIPHQWDQFCNAIGADPDSESLILAIAGYKEVRNEQ